MVAVGKRKNWKEKKESKCQRRERERERERERALWAKFSAMCGGLSGAANQQSC